MPLRNNGSVEGDANLMKAWLVQGVPVGQVNQVLRSIEDWDYTIVPYTLMRHHELGLADYYVGSSRDGKIWALTGNGGEKKRQEPLAVLTDPPERHTDTIAEILTRVWMAGWECDDLGVEQIAEICGQVKFPQYLTVREYLPEAPEDWLHLPSEFGVAVQLSEGACINSDIHNSYERDSLDEVLKMVCAPRLEGHLLRYELLARKVLPLLRWNMDWPLSRRGKTGPWKRTKVQTTFPWEWEADPSLITIYQDAPSVGLNMTPSYWAEHSVRLVVGGRTREQAEANWHRCARAIRKRQRELRAAGEM